MKRMEEEEGRKQTKRPQKTSSAKREKNVHFLFSILKGAMDTDTIFIEVVSFTHYREGNSRKEM